MRKTLRKIISIVLAISIIVGISSVSIFAKENEETVEYATGLIAEDWSEFDEVVVSSPDNTNSLPSCVDLTEYFPTPGDQGGQNSCAAWAVGYALKSSQEKMKRSWSGEQTAHKFSPAFIYNQINGGTGMGIRISEAMNFIVNNGICSLEYFPYNEDDYTTQPTAIQTAAASLYKAQGYNVVGDVYTMKDCISKGNGVVIGIDLYQDFYNISSANQVYDIVYGQLMGRHGICLIGYDDEKEAFKFINSWGTNWGIDGYGWISYDFVASSSVNCNGPGRGFILITSSTDDYVLGDLTGDGEVTAIDARKVLQFVGGQVVPTAKQYALADVNGDAQVTDDDTTLVMKYAAGTIIRFPLYE